MEKKNIDWSSLGFGYVQTDYRYAVSYTHLTLPTNSLV